MAGLNVDLAELLQTAAQTANMAQTTGAGMPTSWMIPGGSDPNSIAHQQAVNAALATVLNHMTGVLNDTHTLSHQIGNAAVDYANADAQGAQAIGGSGGNSLTNPVPEPVAMDLRQVPPELSGMTAEPSGDPLVIAQQLHNGPGPGPAQALADELRAFGSGPHQEAIGQLDNASQTMGRWTPVGSEVSQKLGNHSARMSALQEALGQLADSSEAYSNAFSQAKASHPTPQEIMQNRKDLVNAMRRKDEVGTSAHYAKFMEHNARSAATMSNYNAATGAATGNTGQAASTATGTGASGSSDQTTQLLTSLLPSLISGGMGMANSSKLGKDDSEDIDDGSDDMGVPAMGPMGGGVPSIPPMDTGGGAPTGNEMQNMQVGAMPTSASTTSAAPTPAAATAAAKAPVIEGAGATANGARGAANGGMPYMPMSPGMGGMGGQNGQNGERSRIVAWHPDRLMYVDDTPHTEPVIGERPTIAPTVTPATPAPSGQNPTRAPGANA